MNRIAACLTFLVLLLQSAALPAQLRPEQARVSRFDNGLTLIVLEEHSLPSVSVQMLYRTGARDEDYGRTGVAHFLEHMAFRATARFPDTEVVSRIYAAGGEWHGYTWIDQTTYFATVPSDRLDLLLRIEADRMARLKIDPALVEPERGAVLAEMHGYENDPASVLHDAVVFTALQAHPYRNNTIGWESDVRAIGHDDLVAFYRQHYVPANAVLAVVGDVDPAAVQDRVAALFGAMKQVPATPLPRTVEPPQRGLRQIELLGAGAAARLEVAWQAPAFADPDFPAFLVLQEWLGGGSGVNFLQTSGTTEVRPGSLLYGLAPDMRTWLPPSAQTYLFTIAATVPPDVSPDELEAAVERAIARLRGQLPDADQLRAFKRRVLEELVFDVETHEDAAHQLAFFDGLGALAAWRDLPARIAILDADDVHRVAQRWLQPWQRTVGRYRAGPGPGQLRPTDAVTASAGPAGPPAVTVAAAAPDPAGKITGGIDAAVVARLGSGLPVIVQHSGLSPTAHVRVVLTTSAVAGADALAYNAPVWGVADLEARCLPDELDATLQRLRAAFDDLRPQAAPSVGAEDPVGRLEQLYGQLLSRRQPEQPVAPAVAVVVVAGAVAPDRARAAMARYFADVPYRTVPRGGGSDVADRDLRVALPRGGAQAQIGYAVTAPLPASPDYLPWQALLYVLTHGYEGRLGKEAISRRGLAYYVDGQYRSDGQHAWIAVTTGVDPDKLDAMENLYRSELAALADRPPSDAEVDEARDHLLGRLDTARQSNAEISAGLARQWLWWGGVRSIEERRDAIRGITRQAVLQAIPDFLSGRIAIVEVGNGPATVTD